MAIAFARWSVDDVKQWMNTWTINYRINQTTISNLKQAADAYNINGQRLIYFTRDDLKQFGLNKKDINIIIKRTDALIINTYLDYMIEQRYTKHNKTNNKINKSYTNMDEKNDIMPITDNWQTLNDANTYPRDKRAQKMPIKQRIAPKKYMQKRKQKRAANNQHTNYAIPHNQYIQNSAENRDAVQSIATNKNVHSAARSAMNDNDIRNAAFGAYNTGGNDAQSNRKLVGALARNKKVQGAAISVAKDKKVQKAAYNTAKKHATVKNVKKARRSILSFKI